MNQYIIDTNIFFNMEADIGLGDKTEDVVKKITDISNKLRKKRTAEFIVSPRVIDEFLSFFENKKQPFIQDFLSSIIIRSPDIGHIQVSATVISKLIEEIRIRSYRGLSIAEEEIIKAGREIQDKDKTNKKDFEIIVGKYIKQFRSRYRNATRNGFIDSLADLDCILLAKELNAFLVSTDEGVIFWGRQFGVKEVVVSTWVKQMEKLL